MNMIYWNFVLEVEDTWNIKLRNLLFYFGLKSWEIRQRVYSSNQSYCFVGETQKVVTYVMAKWPLLLPDWFQFCIIKQ